MIIAQLIYKTAIDMFNISSAVRYSELLIGAPRIACLRLNDANSRLSYVNCRLTRRMSKVRGDLLSHHYLRRAMTLTDAGTDIETVKYLGKGLTESAD